MVKFLQRKYIILSVTLLAGLLVVLFVLPFAQNLFFKKKTEREIIPTSKIEIDFRILESQAVQELEPFEKIPPLEGETGRENPFLPY